MLPSLTALIPQKRKSARGKKSLPELWPWWGHFIPCITYGGPGCLYKHVDPIIDDEIDKYNKEVYGV